MGVLSPDSGGVKYGAQHKAMATASISRRHARLPAHPQEKTITLPASRFVLDEADQMLDLGFVLPIRKIVAHVPKVRQNLFFSATMPTEIGKLASELLNDPLRMSVTPQATTVEKVNQKVLFVEQGRKRALLAELFDDAGFKRVIVFTRTKRGADRVARSLEQVGVDAASIQATRARASGNALADKAGKVRALVYRHRRPRHRHRQRQPRRN
jgi:ATP-dependent RNA helicase RhlE